MCVLPVADAPGRCGNVSSGRVSHASEGLETPRLTHYESTCPRHTRTTWTRRGSKGVRRGGKERKEEEVEKNKELLLKWNKQERTVKEHQRKERNQDIAEETNKMNLGDRRWNWRCIRNIVKIAWNSRADRKGIRKQMKERKQETNQKEKEKWMG